MARALRRRVAKQRRQVYAAEPGAVISAGARWGVVKKQAFDFTSFRPGQGHSGPFRLERGLRVANSILNGGGWMGCGFGGLGLVRL